MDSAPYEVVRERSEGGVPIFLDGLEAPSTGISHGMEEFGTAFAGPGGYISKDVGMLWPAVTDELEDHHLLMAPPIVRGPPAPQLARGRAESMDVLHAAEAPLRQLLALASVVGLPRQIEREAEANTVISPRLPSLVIACRVGIGSGVGG